MLVCLTLHNIAQLVCDVTFEQCDQAIMCLERCAPAARVQANLKPL
jgi:hypothetical protein